VWSGRNISTFQSGCSSVFWNVCEFFRGENLLRMNNVCRVVVEVRFWNWLQLITDLIFTKCMFLFFLRGGGGGRLRARIYGPEQSASEERVLKALWVGFIRGVLLRNELRHLSYSLWNSVILNEINQSWSSAPFVWMWEIENSAVEWETVSKIP